MRFHRSLRLSLRAYTGYIMRISRVVPCFSSRKVLQSCPYPTNSTFLPIRTEHCALPHSRLYTAFGSRMTSVKDNGTSDTMKNAIEYTPFEDVEKLERYRPGGYHPTTIGKWLNGRYCIVHKLGFGAYSTIWLARDHKTEKYVAVKITIADSNPTNSQERNNLHRLGIAELKA